MPDLQEVKKQIVNQRKGCSGRGLAHAKILSWKVSGEVFWGRSSRNVHQRGKDGHKNVSAEIDGSKDFGFSLGRIEK